MSFKNTVGPYLFSAILLGYPLFSSIANIIGVENRILSVFFRATLLLFSVSIIYVNLVRLQSIKLPQFNLGILFVVFSFVFLFFLRAGLDTFLYLNDVNAMLDFWVFAVFVTLIPNVAFFFQLNNLQEAKVIKVGMYFGMMVASIFLIAYLKSVNFNILNIFSGRANLQGLNPITIGHLGLTLILLAFAFIMTNDGSHILPKLVSFISLFLGGTILIAGGSRGPLLSLFICIVFIFVFSKNKKIINYIYFTIVIILLIFLYSSSDVMLFNRVSNGFLEDEARDSILIDTISHIINNIYIGSGILSLEVYPHNILLESFLVLGLIGGTLFLSILIFCCYQICFLYSTGKSIVFPLLYIQFLTFNMVSGTINEAFSFWLLSTCIIYYSFKTITSKDS